MIGKGINAMNVVAKVCVSIPDRQADANNVMAREFANMAEKGGGVRCVIVHKNHIYSSESVMNKCSKETQTLKPQSN